MLVDRLGLIDGQVLNIKIGATALADAPISFTPWVSRVIGVATFVAEQSVEGLVEVHGARAFWFCWDCTKALVVYVAAWPNCLPGA